MIFPTNIQQYILSCVRTLFFSQHAPIGLVDAELAHSVVPNRLSRIARQILLPGFGIIRSMALGKAVSLRINASWTIRMDLRCAGPICLRCGNSAAAVPTVPWKVVAQDVTDIFIKLRPRGLVEKNFDFIRSGHNISYIGLIYWQCFPSRNMNQGSEADDLGQEQFSHGIKLVE